MRFADLLKSIRQHKGVQQQELAEKVGVSPATVSDWEHGRKKPRYTNLVKVANVLEADPVELVIALLQDSRSARRDKHGETDD